MRKRATDRSTEDGVEVKRSKRLKDKESHDSVPNLSVWPKENNENKSNVAKKEMKGKKRMNKKDSLQNKKDSSKENKGQPDDIEIDPPNKITMADIDAVHSTTKENVCKTLTGESEATIIRPLMKRSRNLLHCLSQTIAGMRCSFKLSQSLSEPIHSLVRDLQLYRTARPFDRRCTALEWHPRRQGYLAVASKGGDIILWNTNTMGHEQFIEGSGAGGSCQAIKFMPGKDTEVLTASIDGTVRVRDLTGKDSRILLDTHNCQDHWYCSVDVNPSDGVIATGDNFGRVTLVDNAGNESWTKRLHSKKVTHTEFNPRVPWMLCTGSLDKTCKLWDIRMVKDKKSALHVLEHENGLNSAYFNPRDGSQLLTTDQKNEIRVYTGPAWQIQTSITHPHRFFRHLTPIKACWHPLSDLIAVGRYPDQNFPGFSEDEKRTVDVFCAKTGKMLSQLYDPNAAGLVSLNKFSPQGDTLASTMGVNVLIWSRKEVVSKQQEDLMEQYNRDHSNAEFSNSGVPSNQGNQGNSGRSAGTRKPLKEKSAKTKASKAEQKATKEKLGKSKKG